MSDVYTAKQALSDLQGQFKSLDYKNPEHQKQMQNLIRDAVEKVSVKANGKVTVLYSGYINNVKSEDISIKMADKTEIRVLDKTEGFKLLDKNNNEFHELVAKSLGHKDLDSMNKYIKDYFTDDKGDFTQAYYGTPESKFRFDGKDGLWARISKRFAMETEGEVRIMTVNPGEHSVLVNTEIEALLENKKITSIDGSSIDEIMASGNPKSYIIANAAYRTILSNPSEKEYAYWLEMADDKVYQQALDNSDAATRQRIRDAHREITEKFGRPVSEEVTQKVRDTLDNGNNPGTGGGGNPGIGGGNNPGTGGGNNPGTGGGNNSGTGSNPPDIKGGKALPVIGWGFTLLAALSVSEEARAAEEAGDPERAKEIWAEFAVGELGGEIAGTVGGAVGGLVALTVFGLSAPVAAVAGVAVGIVAGIYGEDFAKELYQLTKDMDGNQRMDLFDRLSTFAFGQDFQPQEIPEALRDGAVALRAEMPITELVEKAKTDIAYRYALRELMPVIAAGANEEDFAPFNQDGTLDLFDADHPQGMTESYIRDRAAMLLLQMRYLKNGLKLNRDLVDDLISGDWDYIDFGQHPFAGDVDRPLELSIDGNGIMTDNHRVIFGTDNNPKGEEVLEGGGRADRLYGRGGDDTLKGGEGNDYMEGGAGHDAYHIQDHDTILDTDGKGKLIFTNGRQSEIPQYFIISAPGIENSWVSSDFSGEADGKFTAIRQGDDLIVTLNADRDNRATIKGYFLYQDALDGALMLYLVDEKPEEPIPEPPQEEPTYQLINGDQVAPFFEEDDPDTPQDEREYYNWKATSRDYNSGKLIGGVAKKNFHDVLHGTSQSDRMKGLGGNDAIYGAAGDDELHGDEGHDLIAGGAGVDRIHGGAGDDVLLGYSGLKRSVHWESIHSNGDLPEGSIYSYQNGGVWGFLHKVSNDNERYLLGAIVDTEAQIDEGNLLIGGEGADIIYAGHGDDTIYGGIKPTADMQDSDVSKDDLRGMGGDDLIYGGAGDDVILGDGQSMQPDVFSYTPQALHGHDTIYGEAGNDLIRAGGGNDQIDGGEGNDQILGDAGNDRIVGGAGNDYLAGDDDEYSNKPGIESGDDMISGDDGDDTIFAGKGHDIVSGGSGMDKIWGGDGHDIISGGEGHDTLIGDDDTSSDGDGKASGDDVINGDEGDDGIIAGKGNDIVSGGKGADRIWGNDGKDILSGDEGNDQLHGGEGDDELHGGEDDDAIYGDAGHDVLYGDGGHDQVVGRQGDDILYGGAGDDRMSGDDASSFADKGNETGHDVMYGGAGSDLMLGGKGDDKIHGEAGIDHLHGGEGNDVLNGGEGRDYYYFNSADFPAGERDTVIDSGTENYIFLDDHAAHLQSWTYVAEEQSWISSIGWSAAIEGGNLIIRPPSGQGEVVLPNFRNGSFGLSFIASEQPKPEEPKPEEPKPEEPKPEEPKPEEPKPEEPKPEEPKPEEPKPEEPKPEEPKPEEPKPEEPKPEEPKPEEPKPEEPKPEEPKPEEPKPEESITRYGTSGNDRIQGGSGNDRIQAEGGDDIVRGGAGNDTLYGHDGDDELHGEDGDDILHGEAGHNRLYGGAGNDRLNGWHGNDILHGGDGDDLLNGEAGDDHLEGGEGNDHLNGGAGRDRLNGGNGHDRLYSGSDDDVLYGGDGDDELHGEDGDDILHGEAGHNRLYGGTGNDRLNGWHGNDILHGQDGDDVLLGESGRDILSGGQGNDRLNAGADHDLLSGGAGDDNLNAGTGDDALAGGQGRDRLHGETGDDLYIYRAGDGHDTLFDISGNDTLYLPDFSAEQFLQNISRSGNHLQLRMDADNSLTLQDMFNADHGIEHIALSDGATLNIAQIYQHFGERYTGNSGAYDANRVLDDFNKINGIIG